MKSHALRAAILGCILAFASPALSAEVAPSPPAQQPDPTQQALVQMIQDAQGREAQALVQVYTLRGQLADMKARLDNETRRADEAEARLKAAKSADTDKP